MRPQWQGWLMVPLICVWPLSASGDDADASKLIAECSAPDLPQGSVDSCLERVRVREETDPSSGLQSLEATLERRETGGNMSSRQEARTTSATEFAPAAPATGESGGFVPDNPDNDNYQAPSGSEADDQPPIADPPERASPADSSTDDQSDVPQ